MLASPNKIIWNYFALLRRTVERIAAMPDGDERKQEIAACLILSVTAVEAFTNVYFRVVISEPEFASKAPLVKKGLGSLMSVKDKLTKWTQELFGTALDVSGGIGKSFVDLNTHRNKLVHFKSSHTSISFSNVHFDGMADITAFSSLSPIHAESALATAEGILREVFKLYGIPAAQIPHMMHSWTGKVPSSP